MDNLYMSDVCYMTVCVYCSDLLHCGWCFPHQLVG